ncbi:sensor histidine kinase [Paenibacillus sp. M1]|uniref:histidine kinase n=1 Tax=Paenibacillus haidiansis TaxID=1574488 RepID=A0ABU7VKL0_9BACL
MRLFLRDQRPLIGIYILQLATVAGVFWLDGYRNLAIVLYAALLSGCLLTAYLVYRYITNRSLYRCLEQGDGLDVFKEVKATTPLSESLYRLLKKQYRHYVSELSRQQNKINHHTQFISQWVHQMKTPVSVIHLMIQDSADPNSVAIGDELDRLRQGLDLVLYSARLDAFSQDFVVEKLDLESLVRAAVSAQKRLFIRSKVFPRTEFTAGPLTVASDEKWLTFVLTQIFTNAVKYTAKETGNLQIRGFRRGDETVLEIQDDGVGIPDSDLPRVFDAYFTGENGRNFRESTGMGLHLVKQICLELGHGVELESKIGQGTLVRFIFQTESRKSAR